MRRFAFGPAAVVALAVTVSAQQPPPPGVPTPRINSALPAGAKAGTAADVTVTGYDLDEPTGLVFSHPGIKGEFVPPKDPPPDPKKKDAPPPKKKNRAPTDPQAFKVTVAADVPPGTYDLRLVGKWGVSNPRAFVVGDLQEMAEKEPNNDVPEAQRVEVGTTVNGVIANNTDVDFFAVPARKGQRVVLACLAGSIDSRARPRVEVFNGAGHKLAAGQYYKDADAVTDFVAPADGDYLVRLFEVAYQSGSPDHFYRLSVTAAPWVDAVFPTAVEPGKSSEVTLFGRNLPGGKPSPFVLDGRPLEQATVTVTPPADPSAAQRLTIRDRVEAGSALLDGFEYRVKGSGGVSNAVPIYLSREKVVVKKNAGGTAADKPEPIPAPCEVQGMIHRRGDRDWYSFPAKKGEPVVIEVFGERVGSAADFVFGVYNPAAKNGMIGGEQDDDPDQQNGSLHPQAFYTRTADPVPLRFVPPADGTYVIGVGCRESGYLTGPATAYRLRVGPPRPDFRAVVMPYSRTQPGNAGHSATGAGGWQGGTAAYEVYVQRQDGFAGAVTATAAGLPPGVTARPCVVGPGARWGTLVLEVKADAPAVTGTFTVAARADIGGKEVVREVRPVSVVWGVPQGNNVPVLSRLAGSLPVAVRPEKAGLTLAADPAKAVIKTGGKDEKAAGPLVVKQGDKVTLPVKVTWAGEDKQPVTLNAEPMQPNPQQSPVTAPQNVQVTKDKPEAAVTLDIKPAAAPGAYTVVFRGDTQVGVVRDPMKKDKASVPGSAWAPTVELLVVPTSLAKLTVGPLPNTNVKVGGTIELPVKVERLHDFAGEFKVTLTLPKDVAGVTAVPVSIPAGQDAAKLVVKTTADAKPASLPVTVAVTGAFAGKHPVTTETKAAFNVAK